MTVIKPKDTQNLKYLGEIIADKEEIVSVISKDNHLEPENIDKIITNIDSVVGHQEASWLQRNPENQWAGYLLFRYKFKYDPRQRILNKFPLHLLLEPTSICNISCPMCFQVDTSFRKKEYMGMMDIDLFKSLIDQAVENECMALTLASRGEPLLHKQFGDMLAYCKDKFYELKVITNATKLNEEMAHKILASAVSIVVFSVDSYFKEEYEKLRKGAKFEEVLTNIKRFCEIRNSNESYSKTTTRISGVKLSDEQKKDPYYEFWKGTVDSVLLKEPTYRWDSYGNEKFKLEKPCGLLWERMYVWYEGTCNPCDFDYKSSLAVGDASKEKLKDIWFGEKYNKLRKLSLEGKRSEMYPCRMCHLY
ncbi:MAG: radical SAM protein [Candidatus Scalindua sp.]|jgi:radical SAM protein with 4Fe4S-binding SPASM domain|nr:radical SAM protein [Candidatus Scalindua sp.]